MKKSIQRVLSLLLVLSVLMMGLTFSPVCAAETANDMQATATEEEAEPTAESSPEPSAEPSAAPSAEPANDYEASYDGRKASFVMDSGFQNGGGLRFSCRIYYETPDANEYL